MKSFIQPHLPQLQLAQQEFALAMGGKKILLVDHTFQNLIRGIQEGMLDISAQKDVSTAACAYLHEISEFGLPSHATQLYQQFLGPTLLMNTYDVEQPEVPGLRDIGLVVLTGSPSYITTALSDMNSPATPRTTHLEVLQRSSAVVKHAFEQHIPVIGMCYGHQ